MLLNTIHDTHNITRTTHDSSSWCVFLINNTNQTNNMTNTLYEIINLYSGVAKTPKYYRDPRGSGAEPRLDTSLKLLSYLLIGHIATGNIVIN